MRSFEKELGFFCVMANLIKITCTNLVIQRERINITFSFLFYEIRTDKRIYRYSRLICLFIINGTC